MKSESEIRREAPPVQRGSKGVGEGGFGKDEPWGAQPAPPGDCIHQPVGYRLIVFTE